MRGMGRSGGSRPFWFGHAAFDVVRDLYGLPCDLREVCMIRFAGAYRWLYSKNISRVQRGRNWVEYYTGTFLFCLFIAASASTPIYALPIFFFPKVACL